MRKGNILFVLVLLALCIDVVVFYFYRHQTPTGSNNIAGIVATSTVSVETPYVPPANDTAAAGYHTYVNTAYHFSLQYPDTLAVLEHTEPAGAHSVTFESADGSQGFEIFMVPYTDSQITQSRIDLDTHKGAEGNPVEIVLPATHALTFFSKDPLLGRLREVWFIHGGYLYEVNTYDTLDTWLAGIMQTWKFN